MRVSVFAMLLSAGAASAEPPSGQPPSASDLAAVREADRLRTIDLNHAARARSDRAAARAAQAADARHDAYDRQRRAYEAALEDNRRARERASDAAELRGHQPPAPDRIADAVVADRGLDDDRDQAVLRQRRCHPAVARRRAGTVRPQDRGDRQIGTVGYGDEVAGGHLQRSRNPVEPADRHRPRAGFEPADGLCRRWGHAAAGDGRQGQTLRPTDLSDTRNHDTPRPPNQSGYSCFSLGIYAKTAAEAEGCRQFRRLRPEKSRSVAPGVRPKCDRLEAPDMAGVRTGGTTRLGPPQLTARRTVASALPPSPFWIVLVKCATAGNTRRRGGFGGR
jgi:hypothetical protein